MDTDEGRAARAWAACKAWITQFDGSVTQAEFLDVPLESLESGFGYLVEDAANLRILPIWRDEIKNPPVDLPPEGLIQKLADGDVLSLTINYDILPETDPVEMHLSVFMDAPELAGVSASWWADQVFPDEAEPRLRFENLFEHLQTLENVFSARKMYIGPEAADQPEDPGSLWLEV
jgi:hypothetical protein